MNEEVKSELVAKIDQFKNELDPFFPESGGGNKGVLIIMIDNDASEDKSCMSALVRGKRSALAIAISKAMESSEQAREVLMDGVRFFEFKQNPLMKLLDIIAKE